MDQFYNSNQGGFVGTDSALPRHDSRDSLFLVADFRIAGQPDKYQVRVRNLSSGGLMAEVPEAIAIGTSVEVDVRGIGWVPGRIAWATAGRVGVAFEQPIDPKLARKPVGVGTKTPVFVKPIMPIR
jgi:hypothetical protein